ncbi:MAG: hypothetical protein HYS55_05955, partial [Candidatus Omnitrophica bacterium]|nr:hypothetical protein [Candidatus Omnitrophota bacterium]
MPPTKDKLRKPLNAKRGRVGWKLLSLFLAFTLILFQIPVFAETPPITNELGSPVPTVSADQPLDSSQDQTTQTQSVQEVPQDPTTVLYTESPLSSPTVSEPVLTDPIEPMPMPNPLPYTPDLISGAEVGTIDQPTADRKITSDSKDGLKDGVYELPSGSDPTIIIGGEDTRDASNIKIEPAISPLP